MPEMEFPDQSEQYSDEQEFQKDPIRDQLLLKLRKAPTFQRIYEIFEQFQTQAAEKLIQRNPPLTFEMLWSDIQALYEGTKGLTEANALHALGAETAALTAVKKQILTLAERFLAYKAKLNKVKSPEINLETPDSKLVPTLMKRFMFNSMRRDREFKEIHRRVTEATGTQDDMLLSATVPITFGQLSSEIVQLFNRQISLAEATHLQQLSESTDDFDQRFAQHILGKATKFLNQIK